MELQTMSKSLGSLKALQEVDFSGTKDQIKAMSNFYSKLNEAMADLSDTVEDTKQYKDQLSELNKNISGLNTVYSSLNNVYGKCDHSYGRRSRLIFALLENTPVLLN